MKTGIVTKNRNEGNFIKRMATDKRDHYIKDWIARCNHQALVPAIRITKHDRYWRTIRYEIRIGDTVVPGVTHKSRSESDLFLSLSKDKREQSVKQFIAACNPALLIPFIEITGHDKNYRSIEYRIDTEIAI